MSILNKSVKENLIGNVHLLKKVTGYSAYDLAVNEGFKGTIQEWLKSLKGDPGTLESHTGFNALGHRVMNVADPVNDDDAAVYKQVKCEDISEDFFKWTTNEEAGATLTNVSVFKQGRIITGSYMVTCENGLKESPVIGVAKEKYAPKKEYVSHLITVNKEGEETTYGTGAFSILPAGMPILPGGTFGLLFVDNAKSAYVNFTYICN